MLYVVIPNVFFVISMVPLILLVRHIVLGASSLWERYKNAK